MSRQSSGGNKSTSIAFHIWAPYLNLDGVLNNRPGGIVRLPSKNQDEKTRYRPVGNCCNCGAPPEPAGVACTYCGTMEPI